MINEREVTILETENFGKLAYVEVGATCVGKEVNRHIEKTHFIEAMKKGCFSSVAPRSSLSESRVSGSLMTAYSNTPKMGLRLFQKMGQSIGRVTANETMVP